MSTQETTPPVAAQVTADKKPRLRSPAYPYINLEEAEKLARIIWEKENRHPVPVSVAAVHWKYGAKSSTGALSVSALKKFGLLKEEGAGDKRTVKLSDLGLDLIKFADVFEERLKLLKIAALKPEIHKELWTTHRDASDASLRRYLEFDRKFNGSVVDVVIKEYRDTISFAQLTDADIISDTSGDAEDDADSPDERPMETTEKIKKDPAHHQPPPAMAAPLPAGLIEIPVPLPSGALAFYRVPATMSEADFAFYTTLLTAYKAGIVKGAPAS